VGRIGKPSDPIPVAIALGSNLGDRRGHLTWAIDRLSRVLTKLRASTLIETEPFDVPEPQPPYLNGVVVGETTLEPRALLDTLLASERSRGRRRLTDREPRTLDLDLILYGDRIIDEDRLVVPHPRFRERRFVLQPLAEVGADWIDPVTGKTVQQLLDQLRT
jgi:2-amino-4-hydroxy-6-hydroxymethyldihydropteridine diphosphokinase